MAFATIRTSEFLRLKMKEQIWFEYLYISCGELNIILQTVRKRGLSSAIYKSSKISLECELSLITWQLVRQGKSQLSNVAFLITENWIQRPLKFSDRLEIGKEFELVMIRLRYLGIITEIATHYGFCHGIHSTGFSLFISLLHNKLK